VAYEVTAVEPISVRHCWCRTLLKQASNKSWNQNHNRGGLVLAECSVLFVFGIVRAK